MSVIPTTTLLTCGSQFMGEFADFVALNDFHEHANKVFWIELNLTELSASIRRCPYNCQCWPQLFQRWFNTNFKYSMVNGSTKQWLLNFYFCFGPLVRTPYLAFQFRTMYIGEETTAWDEARNWSVSEHCQPIGSQHDLHGVWRPGAIKFCHLRPIYHGQCQGLPDNSLKEKDCST